MAITTTRRAVTPLRIRYTVDSNAGGETASITRATLLTDCMPGPLREFFRATENETTWDEMLSQAPQLSGRIINGGVANNLVRLVTNGNADPALSAIEVIFGAGAIGQVILELELIHSMVR